MCRFLGSIKRMQRLDLGDWLHRGYSMPNARRSECILNRIYQSCYYRHNKSMDMSFLHVSYSSYSCKLGALHRVLDTPSRLLSHAARQFF
jgi:hypothetical protein